MISTLQPTFKIKKELHETASDLKINAPEVIARLVYLINNLSEEQQFVILKQFLNGNTAKLLLKLSIDMSNEQRFIFMRHLEETHSESEKPDRRDHPRKDCLINVDFKIRGQKFNSYILDLSPSGAFIETSESFSSGLKLLLNFSSPENRKPLTLIGEIVWADPRGIGVKFHQLNKNQVKILKSFSEKTEEILEINS